MRAPRALWLILVSSLVLKLALLGIGNAVPEFADERQYLSAALSIAETGVPKYANPQWDEAHYPPVYPYFMGACCKLFGAQFPSAVRILQALMSTATAWLLFLAARRLFDERTALISAAIWAFFPTAITYTHLYLGETLYALLVLAVPVILLGPPGTAAIVDAGKGRLFLAGIFAGLSTLTRSIFLPQSLLISLWIVFAGRGDWRARLKPAALFLAGLVCTIVPWSVRNTLRYERFLLIDTGAGNVLHLNWNMVDPWNNDIGLLGRHQKDRECAKAEGIQRRRRFHPEDPDDPSYIVVRNQGEIRLALDWLAENPGLFARHSVIRAAEFVNPTSMLVFRLRNGDYGEPPTWLRESLVLLVVASTMLLLWAGFVGMGFFAFEKEHALYALLFFSAFAAGALLMSITRYRFPSMPLLVPFAVQFMRSRKTLPAPRDAKWQWGLAAAATVSLLAVFVIYVPLNYSA